MKILIFEGIATSGKSTIIERIVDSAGGEMKVVVALEGQTHEPIMAERSELNISFFSDLINKLTLKNPDLLMFDRLYITQAYRARSDLAHYSSLEDALLPSSPHTIILKVDETAIAERIKSTSERREGEWLKYLKTKGNSFEEIAQDYIEQQRSILLLVKQSKIPYTVFDTTDHNYDEIAGRVLGIVRE